MGKGGNSDFNVCSIVPFQCSTNVLFLLLLLWIFLNQKNKINKIKCSHPKCLPGLFLTLNQSLLKCHSLWEAITSIPPKVSAPAHSLSLSLLHFLFWHLSLPDIVHLFVCLSVFQHTVNTMRAGTLPYLCSSINLWARNAAWHRVDP